MARVEVTTRALADLERLFDFLAEHNPKLTRERIISVRRAFELLADHPFLGREADGALLFGISMGSFQIPGSLRGGITRVILGRMKTAISIPDEIFEQAERLAKTRGWSRSELYANAVSAFVNSERFSGVREKLDAVYGDGGEDSAVEPLLANAQARSIAKEKW